MAYDKKYYESHKEKFLEASKKYLAKKRAEADPEWLSERSEYMCDYYRSHPEQKEKKKEYDKEWRKKHPNYFKDYYKKRKQLKKEENNKNSL